VLAALHAAERPRPAALDRFAHEYELRDKLESAWAARPLELTSEGGRPVLLLEDPGGEPLERLLGAPMETERFLGLAIGISGALSKAHGRGLVHKDLKPANILANCADGQVRLTGFGIASILSRERQLPHPPETIAGTLAYMAPEQTGRMNRSIDSRSDLYALGVTFYQMLTGALPFSAADPMEWVHCHLARRPAPPAERLREIPSGVSAIVMKLLAKRAEDRYQTAAGLESDLRSCLIEWEAQGRIDDFPLGEHDTSDRLLIPEKLYGRRREVETLLASFDRVFNGGAPELVLVSGYSGVGKSSVVNELQPVLVPPRGLFASGKFDQYKRDIPYATLAQAFQSLIRPLLGKSEAELTPWRDALREALGPNAGLIVDLVPEVRLIVGEPPPVAELPPQDAQRRFQLVFRQFIGVFARPEHPLALFLDDLQWLDAASLDLVEDLLNRSDLRNLLLIGAFRDNEVTAAHPLMRKLEAIRATGRVQDIKLAPLRTEHLEELVADSLRCDAELAAPLAGLVHAKTDGNPFFVIQFLHVLAGEGLLAFDHERARWSWDLEGIHTKRYTDNVVDLLARKLTRLPLGTQEALQQLACLGHVADVAMLSIIAGTSEEGVHAALWEARRHQLIDRVDRSYKFIHDRMQEAAYALIPENARTEAHLRIGRVLLARTPPDKRDEEIFEIVNQLNRGAPLITSQQEREQLAELNLAAGKRAKASSAYASALTYFTAGAALLPGDAWERRQELAFELELHPADCEVCTGALQAAEQRLAALATRTVDNVQRCIVAQRRVDLHVILGAAEKVVAVALECLRHVGIDWSAHPTEVDVRREYERIWSLLGDRTIEDLVDLPLIQDPEAQATLHLLASLVLPALYTDTNLLALSACTSVNLSLQHGNGEGTVLNYAAMALIAGVRFGHYAEGYRFGKLACDLLERRGLTYFGARTYTGFAIVVPWTRPLREGIEPSRRAFQMAKENGDPAYAAFASRGLSTILLALGHPLDQFEREGQDALEFVQRYGFFLDRLSAPIALARTLRGRTAKFGSLDDGGFTERSFEERITGQPSRAFLEGFYWIRKLQARFFAGDYVSAFEAAERVEAWYATSPALALFPLEKAECHFYAGLCRAARCEPVGPDPYAEHREALGAHERHLRAWAARCPQNFEDRAALVAAELARIEGRPLEAMDLYERAIVSARANGFAHNEALACELAARFYAARGLEGVAHHYLGNARRGYLRWGADGKVRQLDQLHPRLRQDERTPGLTGTIETPVEQLDLATVIMVSQAVSGDIVLEKLLETLMRTAAEQSGAVRGLLILPRRAGPRIVAEVTTGDTIVVQLRDEPLTETSLPESVVHYVLRIRENVILDDAATNPQFAADPYIRQRQARSLLCMPLLNQGQLIGVLYLENNLTPRVFAPARIAVLKLIAAQAAISLEKTRSAEQLRRSEAYLAEAQRLSLTGSFGYHPASGELSWSEETFRIFGYDPLVKPSIDLLLQRCHPDDAPLLREVIERAAGGQQEFDYEHRLLMPDGAVKMIHVRARALNGEPDGSQLVGAVMDITARHERELESTRLAAIVSSSDDAIISKTLDGRIVSWNAGATSMLGYEATEMIGQTIFRIIPPELHEEEREILTRLGRGERIHHYEATRIARDGHRVEISMTLSPLSDKSGKVIGASTVARDITESRQAESELQRVRTELARIARVTTLGELTAAIAHEVNQPLTGVISSGNACQRWLAGDPPNLEAARRSIQRMIDDGNRASDVISRIRDMVRKSPPRRDAFNINDTILEVLALLRIELSRNNISPRVELSNDLPLVFGDRIQLQQVILNLIMNAIEAMSEIGETQRKLLVASAKDVPDGVLVTIEDSGAGLDGESLDHLFEAFFTTKARGMGMGLSVSQTILQAHGGRLWATPNAPQGATFQFTLPADNEMAA
jgi:PAS domain S-box-containing protein